MTHKIAMRYRLADAGVPQPRFAAARTLHEARAAAATVGFPAVLKPADSAGQRGIFLLESPGRPRRAPARGALGLADGRGDPRVVPRGSRGEHAARRLGRRGAADHGCPTGCGPPGVGFGVALAHLYPSTVYGDALAEVGRVAVADRARARAARRVAFRSCSSRDGVVRVVEAAARIPAGQMDDVPRYGVGDRPDRGRRCGSRSARTCRTSCVEPRFQQPLAIRFLTAEPGPLPPGVVEHVGTLERARALPGVVQAYDCLGAAGRDDPAGAVDGDRRGYVIALGGDEPGGARPRGCGGAADGRARAMSCSFDLAHYRELLEAARAGGYRPASSTASPPRATCCCATTSTSRSTAALRVAELEAEAEWPATYFLMTESVFYNLASPEGAARDRAAARARPPRRPARRLARAPSSTTASTRSLAWHNPDPEYMSRAGRRRRERDGAAVLLARDLPLRLEPALAPRLPARGARARASSRGCSCSRTRRSGPTRARRWARRCSRCSTPSGTGGSSSSPRTGSTCREADDDPRHRLRRARHRRAPARRCARTASGPCGSSERTCPIARSAGTSATRSTSCRPAPTPASPTRCSTSASARASTRCCRSRRSTCAGSPRRATASRACAVLVASPEAIRRSNDKAETYALLDRIGVPAPAVAARDGRRGGRGRGARARLPRRRRLLQARLLVRLARLPRALGVGRPARAAAHEPAGRRGRDAARGGRRAAPGRGRAGAARDGARDAAASGRSTGSRPGGRIALGHPKTREAMRAGLAMYFETLDDPALMEVAARIVAELGLDHFFNIQLVGDYVIEINPRISTIVYQEDLNIPWLGVKHALGEISADELGAFAGRVRPGRGGRCGTSTRSTGTRCCAGRRRRVARAARREDDGPCAPRSRQARVRRARTRISAPRLRAGCRGGDRRLGRGAAPTSSRTVRELHRAPRRAGRVDVRTLPRVERVGMQTDEHDEWLVDSRSGSAHSPGDLGRARVRASSHCPVNTAGVPVAERARRCAAQGRRREARRLRALQAPPGGRLVASTGTAASPGGSSRSGARSRSCCRTPTSSTSTSGSRSCRSRSSSRSCARPRRKSVVPLPRLRHPRQAAAELAYGRRAGAQIVGSYDAVRWVPEAEVVPPGIDLARVRRAAAGRDERPVILHAPSSRAPQGHRARDRGRGAACRAELALVEGLHARRGARATTRTPTSSSTS